MRVPDLLAAVSTSAMRLPAIAVNIVAMLQVTTGPLDVLALLLCMLAGVVCLLQASTASMCSPLGVRPYLTPGQTPHLS